MATAAEKPRDPMVRISEPDRESRPRPPPLEMSSAGTSLDLPKTPTRREKEKKIGHRRVDDTGQVTYKKKTSAELMATIQLGMGQSVGGLASKPDRDVLYGDFATIDSKFFPREGSNLTPAHHYSDFRFKTFAPIAFRYFRELFSIQPDDFLLSLCNEALHELSNPGASGSIFYITNDDEFIIKTVQHKEADFLQKLLPGYYMNLNQNPRTLLPKFYGLYCYQCGGKNIRFVVMNNLLPTAVKMHEKYDLKGSTYKRKASRKEKQKASPTLKDLDFLDNHPDGIMLEGNTYDALIGTINRDCRVLQSFKIMDYSLLLGIHNLDQAAKSRMEEEMAENAGGGGGGGGAADQSMTEHAGHPRDRADTQNTSISRGKSMRQRVAQYSTAMEAIAAPSEPLELDNEDIPPGGIPARNTKGERLLLYIGLIDILQNYRFQKRMEHALKAMVHDGDTISVHRPGFYSTRFQSFFSGKVFKKIPSLDQPQVKGPHMRFKKLVQLALKQSPSKKRAAAGGRLRSVTTTSEQDTMGGATTHRQTSLDMSRHRAETAAADMQPGAMGGRPDLLPENSTPPPTFAEALSDQRHAPPQRASVHAQKPEVITTSPSFQSEEQMGGPHGGGMINSPVHSMSESTPTHTEYTEGTPSFTTSSPSCSSDMLDSLPSTTKSTRREFNNGTTTTVTTVTTSSTTRLRQTSTSSSGAGGGVEVTHEDIDFDLPADQAGVAEARAGRPMSLAKDNAAPAEEADDIIPQQDEQHQDEPEQQDHQNQPEK